MYAYAATSIREGFMKRPRLIQTIAFIFALVLLGSNAESRGRGQDPLLGDQAKAAFAALKKLAGEWRGKSTKGWTEKIDFQVIAGGSVLMDRSFGAHPDEWMATMIHMDGDRLLLTHYCIAKNQPRLVATKATGSEITFEFLDATNLKSRDQGHMDKVVIKLDGDDRFTSRWTWFQDGKESWMEEIEHRREAPKAPARLTARSMKPKAAACCAFTAKK
jgi:hypothetical protein